MNSAFLQSLTAAALLLLAAPVSATGQFSATPGSDQTANITHPTPAEQRMTAMLRNTIYPYSSRGAVEGVLTQNHLHFEPDSKKPNNLVVTVERSPQNHFVVGTLRATFKFDQNNLLVTYDVEEELPGEAVAIAGKEQTKAPVAKASEDTSDKAAESAEGGTGEAAESASPAANAAVASAEGGTGEAAESASPAANTAVASAEGGTGESAEPASPAANAAVASAEGGAGESAANTGAAPASPSSAGSDNTSLGAPPAAAAVSAPASPPPAKPAYTSASAAPVAPPAQEAPPAQPSPAYTGGFMPQGVNVLQGGFHPPQLPANTAGLTLPPTIAAMVGAGQPIPSGGAASQPAVASPFFAPQAASAVPPPPGGMELPAMPGER